MKLKIVQAYRGYITFKIVMVAPPQFECASHTGLLKTTRKVANPLISQQRQVTAPGDIRCPGGSLSLREAGCKHLRLPAPLPRERHGEEPYRA